jgi:hypothetical protein
LYIGCYDQDQLKKWLDCFQKAKKFSDWLISIKIMLEKHEKNIKKKKGGLLNEHLLFKLSEIVEFCESFCGSESFEIQNLTLKQAQTNDEQKKKIDLAVMESHHTEVKT